MQCWRTKSLLLVLAVALVPHEAISSNAVETSGDVLLGLIPAAAFGATWLHENDCDGRLQFFKGFAVNQAVTQGLKYTIHKDRPDDSDDHSFPSGHTSTTFQAAAFLQKRYGWTWGLPAYLGAAYTGWTRVDSDKHYVEDVLAGAVIGAVSGWYFTESYKGMAVIPAVSRDYVGLSLTMQW